MSEQLQESRSKATRLPAESKLAAMRRRRHENGRDFKIVITQRDSETGGGKTTLAVWLALQWDINGWDGLRKGTLEPEEFLKTYPELDPHSVIIMDEAEELDARRSMASENIEFSKHWMTMRTRQIDSILTLPSAGALDKRLLELADVRINVTRRGHANCYRAKVDDHDREVHEWFMEELSWPDVSEHPEFKKLDEQKQAYIDSATDERNQSNDDGSQKALKRAIREEAKRRRRNGEKLPNIISRIPNNPETGAPYHKSTVYRWIEDIELPEELDS